MIRDTHNENVSQARSTLRGMRFSWHESSSHHRRNQYILEKMRGGLIDPIYVQERIVLKYPKQTLPRSCVTDHHESLATVLHCFPTTLVENVLRHCRNSAGE